MFVAYQSFRFCDDSDSPEKYLGESFDFFLIHIGVNFFVESGKVFDLWEAESEEERQHERVEEEQSKSSKIQRISLEVYLLSLS